MTPMKGVVSRVGLVGLQLCLWVGAATSARADVTGPSFDCARAREPLGQLICMDPGLSREDLRLIQAYQALRASLAEAGQFALRQEAIGFQAKVLATCSIPATGTANWTMLGASKGCVAGQYGDQREAWAARLSGPALEEATRPLALHGALQARLAEGGFLPPGSAVDGVYGPGMRLAIAGWQRATGRNATGVLGNADADALNGGAPGAGVVAGPGTFPGVAGQRTAPQPAPIAPFPTPMPAALPPTPPALPTGQPPREIRTVATDPAQVARQSQQSSVEIIASSPCQFFTPSNFEGKPYGQWLPFGSTGWIPPNDPRRTSSPFGVPYLQWGNREFMALKARARQCSPDPANARFLMGMLSQIDEQQRDQVPVLDGIRREQADLAARRTAALAELAAAQQLTDLEAQVVRLRRLQADIGSDIPDLSVEVTAAIDAALVRIDDQRAAAELASRRQTVENQAAANRAAVEQREAAARQLEEASQRAATADAQRERELWASRRQEAEQQLAAARQAVEQEDAAAKQRKEAADRATAAAGVRDRELQAARQQAAADEARLQEIAREQAAIDARRREQAAARAADEAAVRQREAAQSAREAAAAPAPSAPAPGYAPQAAALAPPPTPSTAAPAPQRMAVAQSALPARAAGTPPPAQQGVIAAVQAARNQYARAPNDMAKGASRPTRAQAICSAIGSRYVQNWIGIVAALSSNGDGKGVLRIDIGGGATAGTWDNVLSDLGDNTLMEPTSPVFQQAVALRVGQKVRFSGTFVASDTDCLEELSVTLSGSIDAPEFILKFETVVPAE